MIYRKFRGGFPQHAGNTQSDVYIFKINIKGYKLLAFLIHTVIFNLCILWA